MPKNTLTVLIAEDEERILALIKSLIDWDALGLKLVGEAPDGESALRQIGQKQPDIVITDIRMPGANGLNVAEWITRNLPNSRVIVISGYKQFDYAYDALKLNVSDFLIKPINRDDLNKSLLKIVNQHSSERVQELHDMQIENEIQRNRMNLRRQFLLNLLYCPHIPLPDLESCNTNNALEFQPGMFFAIAIQVGGTSVGFENYIQESGRSASNLNSTRVSGVVAAKLKDIIINCLCGICHDLEGILDGDRAFLIGNIDPGQLPVLHRACKRAMNTMQEHATVFPGIRFAMGVSHAETDHHLLSDLLQNASDALVCSKVCGCELPIFAEKQDASAVLPALAALESDIRRAVTIHDVPAIQRAWLRHFNEIRPRLEAAPLLINALIDQLLNIMWATARDNYHLSDFKLQPAIRNYLRSVPVDLDNFSECACSMLHHQYSLWQDAARGSETMPVRTLKRYIQEHCHENLGLENLAAVVGFSTSHISALFKRETGTTIVDYITQCRIERAKELLASTMMSINEIAEAVGYQDAKYFSRIFRKQVCIKPSEYRQLHQWCNVK